jgi:hypothetical protein
MGNNIDIETIAVNLVLAKEAQEGRYSFIQKTRGCGWDLSTATKDHSEIRYIEIKSTKTKKLVGRWLEKAGYEHLKNNKNFWIYSVTECKEDGSGIIKKYNWDDLQKLEIKEEIKYVVKF